MANSKSLNPIIKEIREAVKKLKQLRDSNCNLDSEEAKSACSVIKNNSNLRREFEKSQWEDIATIYINEKFAELFISFSNLQAGTKIDQLKSWKGITIYDNLLKALNGLAEASVKFGNYSIKTGIIQHLIKEIEKYIDPVKPDNIFLLKYGSVLVSLVQYDEAIEKFREVNSVQLLERYYKLSTVYALKYLNIYFISFIFLPLLFDIYLVQATCIQRRLEN